jgi:hypothetical protein
VPSHETRLTLLSYPLGRTLLREPADLNGRDVPGVVQAMSDSPRQRIPGYLGAMAVFATTTAATALIGRTRGETLPDRYAASDLALGAIATHKFARVVAKDAVTTPIRAPFTEFESAAGSGEVNDTAKQSHPEHTIGELITCPFCLAPWVATAYVAGLTLSPRAARTWAAVFSVVAGSDALQHVYARLRTE